MGLNLLEAVHFPFSIFQRSMSTCHPCRSLSLQNLQTSRSPSLASRARPQLFLASLHTQAYTLCAGVGVVAILMGLNLLEVIQLRFPTLDVDVRGFNLPPLPVAFLAGLTFALAASPCSTPILATLLAFAMTQDTAAVGASLLFAYSIGYVAPLLLAASATVRSRRTRISMLKSVRCISGV
jgi:cytochrome c biogenesis protein CcdA